MNKDNTVIKKNKHSLWEYRTLLSTLIHIMGVPEREREKQKKKEITTEISEIWFKKHISP